MFYSFTEYVLHAPAVWHLWFGRRLKSYHTKGKVICLFVCLLTFSYNSFDYKVIKAKLHLTWCSSWIKPILSRQTNRLQSAIMLAASKVIIQVLYNSNDGFITGTSGYLQHRKLLCTSYHLEIPIPPQLELWCSESEVTYIFNPTPTPK